MSPADAATLLDLLRRERFDTAAAFLEARLTGAPAQPDLLHWLGYARWRQGRLADAESLMARAVAARPDNVSFLANLGALLLARGRAKAAAEVLRRALALQPGMPGAHNNLANALRALGEIDAAGEHYEAALATQPDLPEAHNNLANIRKEQGRLDEATQHYRRALALRPAFREAFSNLLALTRLSDEIDIRESFALHREFADRFEAPLRGEWGARAVAAEPGRMLRVGYVSPDCHPAASLFLAPVWRHHDRERHALFAYFDAPPRAELANDLAGMTVRVLAGLSDEAVAAQIRADRIDVLIDIAGHAGNSRILVFARKPAPVQVTWLDYLGTTGLAAMDFRLTDRWADPPGAERYHSERLLRFPDGFCQWCYPGPASAPRIGGSPAGHHGYITFASFNNPLKITPASLALWSRVLAAVPEARLRVFGVGSDAARALIEDHFSQRRQGGRIEMAAPMPYADFFEACNDVDIGLDPLLFSGATTTCDVMWMGVPVITLPGAVGRTASASRSTASILRCVGLPQLIAASAGDYVAIARSLAEDREMLAGLRARLRETLRASPLMDAAGFTRALETLLRTAAGKTRS